MKKSTLTTLLLSLFLGLFLSACASKSSFNNSKSVFITIKTPQIKQQEAGFLYTEGEMVRLEIYKLGQPIVKLEVATLSCLNGTCAPKMMLNEKLFKNAHYDGFLSDILRAKPLYSGKNLVKTKCGFTQQIAEKAYEIEYSVCDGVVDFYEKKAKIVFVMKDLEQ